MKVSGVRCQVLKLPNSYEATPNWHGFLMIKLAVFQASGWAET